MFIIVERKVRGNERGKKKNRKNWLTGHEQVNFFWVSSSIKWEMFPGLSRDQVRKRCERALKSEGTLPNGRDYDYLNALQTQQYQKRLNLWQTAVQQVI